MHYGRELCKGNCGKYTSNKHSLCAECRTKTCPVCKKTIRYANPAYKMCSSCRKTKVKAGNEVYQFEDI